MPPQSSVKTIHERGRENENKKFGCSVKMLVSVAKKKYFLAKTAEV